MTKELLKLRINNRRIVAMGPGKADLLEAIDANGSISSAAKHMHMSYRRAWELVDVMNKSFKEPLVVSSPGGQHGGGARLTEYGYMILKTYRDLVAKTCIAGAKELEEFSSHLKQSD